MMNEIFQRQDVYGLALAIENRIEELQQRIDEQTICVDCGERYEERCEDCHRKYCKGLL